MKSLPLSPLNAARLVAHRRRAHPQCVVCSPPNAHGLGVEFACSPDGSVWGELAGAAAFQGYTGKLHGGIIAALLDGAMTNCLFAHDHEAMTAELTVRYRHPVLAEGGLTVRAWLTGSYGPLFRLEAELVQGGQVKATATGKFMAAQDPGQRTIATSPQEVPEAPHPFLS